MPTFRQLGLVLVTLGAFAPASALATYSIVAADRASKQVGGAVTSCVAPSGVGGVYGSAPGRGAVASQAASNRAGRDRAVQLLLMGVAPDQIIATLISQGFDPGAARRQYGVVDMMGRAAGHSGTGNGVFSNDVQGDFEGFTYSIQGNILTGPGVLTQAQAAFQGESCDLAERLMRALEAGAQNNQGDRRCTTAGAPSDSAFIQVDLPDQPAGTYLRLSVVAARRNSPLPGLRAQFDAWRRTHPCPDGPGTPPPPDAGPVAPNPPRDAGIPRPDTASGGTGGTGGGGGPGPRPDTGAPQGGRRADAAAGGTAGQPGSTPPGTAGAPAPAGTGGASGTPAPTPPSPGGAGAPAAQTPDAMPAGCDCHTGGAQSPGGLAALALAVLSILARRRRH